MSGTILFANNAGSVLAQPLASTATTALLAPGTGILFPQPANGSFFIGTIVSQGNQTIREIVRVTSMAGDTIASMVRGQENTPAIPWNQGDYFQVLITAGTLQALQAQTTGLLPIAGGTMTGPLNLTFKDGYVAAGNSQLSSTPLTTQVSVITTAAGGAFILDCAGPVTVLNQDTEGNPAIIYPPASSHFNQFPVGTYVEIAAGGSATFYPGSSSTQWWF
jgi:hypothetical protein